MTLFFFGGYTIGSVYGTQVPVSPTAEPQIIPAAASEVKSVSKYELILSNSELMLFKRVNERRELLYSHPIIESLYPPDDIEELKHGVDFDNLSDAQSLLENFVS